MKVYIITREPFPNGMAATKRIISYAKGWINGGIDVEVLIYNRTEKYGRTPRNNEGIGVYEGIKFRYIKGTPLRESNIFIRALNDFYDRIRLENYLKLNLNSGDFVYAFNSSDICSKGVIKTVHYCGAKYAQEICELPFGTTLETKKNVIKRRIFEKKIMPLLDGVVAISDNLLEYASKYCNGSCQISKIPILVDFEKYRMEDRSNEASTPYIFHCGTLYQQKDGFLDLLKAFGIASNKLPFEVKFYSTGKIKGSRHEKEITEIIKEYNLQDKVEFLGYLSDNEIKDYLSKAKFVVVNKLSTQQNKYCFATKLGEYMAASKAVITTSVGEAMNWIQHGKDSYIIKPDNYEMLSQAIEKLFVDNRLCEMLGTNAQETCLKEFSIKANSKKLKSFVLRVAGNITHK